MKARVLQSLRMATRKDLVYLAIFLFILAPIGAVVLITAQLLFGIPPPVVFAPGRAVKSLLELCGLHPANRVAVASTGVFWWTLIAGVGLAWERRRTPRL